MTYRRDDRIAKLTDEELLQVVREYDEWNETGVVQDDAKLRRLSAKFGQLTTQLAMLTTATLVFREIIERLSAEVGEAYLAKSHS